MLVLCIHIYHKTIFNNIHFFYISIKNQCQYVATDNAASVDIRRFIDVVYIFTWNDFAINLCHLKVNILLVFRARLNGSRRVHKFENTVNNGAIYKIIELHNEVVTWLVTMASILQCIKEKSRLFTNVISENETKQVVNVTHRLNARTIRIALPMECFNLADLIES